MPERRARSPFPFAMAGAAPCPPPPASGMAAFMPPPARRVVPGLDNGGVRRDACPPAPAPPTVPLPAPGAYALMHGPPRSDVAAPWRHHHHPLHAAGPAGAGGIGPGTSPHSAHLHALHAVPSTGHYHPHLGAGLWGAPLPPVGGAPPPPSGAVAPPPVTTPALADAGDWSSGGLPRFLGAAAAAALANPVPRSGAGGEGAFALGGGSPFGRAPPAVSSVAPPSVAGVGSVGSLRSSFASSSPIGGLPLPPAWLSPYGGVGMGGAPYFAPPQAAAASVAAPTDVAALGASLSTRLSQSPLSASSTGTPSHTEEAPAKEDGGSSTGAGVFGGLEYGVDWLSESYMGTPPGSEVDQDEADASVELSALAREQQADLLRRLETCLRKRKLDRALAIVREGVTAHLLGVRHANAVLDALGKSGRVAEAQKLFEQFDHPLALRRDVATHSIMVSTYGKSGRVDLAEAAFQRMKDEGVQPNAFTYSALIEALGRAGRLARAEAVFRFMHEDGVVANVVAYNALMKAHVKRNRVNDAFKLADEMVRIGRHPDVVTYGTLIDGCAKARNVDKAFEVFATLRAADVKPNRVCFASLIDACSKARQPD
ncbi:hypothetical protein BU14_0464s0012, partial [Porphyra umbilicalis]